MSKNFAKPLGAYFIGTITATNDIHRVSKPVYEKTEAEAVINKLSKENPGVIYVLYEAISTHVSDVQTKRLWQKNNTLPPKNLTIAEEKA